jgi:hypothetical protein
MSIVEIFAQSILLTTLILGSFFMGYYFTDKQ